MYHEYVDDAGNTFPYFPTAPRPDFEPTLSDEAEYASRRRIMVRHEGGEPKLFVAPGGEMNSGWVIGVELVE